MDPVGAQIVLGQHLAPALALQRNFQLLGNIGVQLVVGELAQGGRHHALIVLGCVIRGDTRHYEHVADLCAQGLMRVALDTGVPVLNGVLAVEKFEDAQARAGGSHGNKGEEAALAALEMVNLLERLR